MTPKQQKEIQATIKETIQENVNGKIDIISRKLDTYIKEDNEWKVRAEPVILMGENVRGFGKVSLYVVGFVASVSGAVILIINLFKNK